MHYHACGINIILYNNVSGNDEGHIVVWHRCRLVQGNGPNKASVMRATINNWLNGGDSVTISGDCEERYGYEYILDQKFMILIIFFSFLFLLGKDSICLILW